MENNDIIKYKVKDFLFHSIKEEYGYGYIPEYHQDIIKMDKYYVDPSNNIFLLAFLKNSNKLIGTLGIRAYDKDFNDFKGVYDNKTTAGVWRVFIDKKWRRNGLASSLVDMAEYFCRKRSYSQIYLHTHKTVKGSLNFWLSNGYKITLDTGNENGTVHMEKKL